MSDPTRLAECGDDLELSLLDAYDSSMEPPPGASDAVWRGIAAIASLPHGATVPASGESLQSSAFARRVPELAKNTTHSSFAPKVVSVGAPWIVAGLKFGIGMVAVGSALTLGIGRLSAPSSQESAPNSHNNHSTRSRKVESRLSRSTATIELRSYAATRSRDVMHSSSVAPHRILGGPTSPKTSEEQPRPLAQTTNSTMAEEAERLLLVRKVASQGRLTEARALLDESERLFPAGVLWEERQVMRLEIEWKVTGSSDAVVRFLAQNPGSVFRGRLEKMIGGVH